MCICMLFPDEASQQDLVWNNFKMGETARGSFWRFIAFHTQPQSCHDSQPFLPQIPSSLHHPHHPPLFHHFPSLTVIKGDSNGKSDQVTGGHLTSLVFLSSSLSSEFPLKSFMFSAQLPPPPTAGLHFHGDRTGEDWSAGLKYCWKTCVTIIE